MASSGEADAALDGVREVQEARLLVVDGDVDDLGVEDLLDLVAHEVVHGLHLELGGEALLDAVDDGQLGGSLAGLVDEPSVLEGHAEAGRQRGQQPTSASLKACVRSRFWSEMMPVATVPTSKGTTSIDLAGSPWMGTVLIP